MSDGFRVDDTALAEHARVIDQVAARMWRVADAATPVDLAAYGLIGRAFAGAAASSAAAGSTAVGDLARQAVGLRDAIHATRAAYLDVERQHARGFGTSR